MKLPAEKEDVQTLLARIGVDGVMYEELFITDYKTNISGLYDLLGEYESIDELNYLSVLLSDMDTGELEMFSAALEFGECRSVKDIINLTQNLDCYELYPGISNDEDLGRYYIEELCTLEVPEHLQSYIDYEAYGRDIYMEESGLYTDEGYVVNTGGSIEELYTGREDIPEEYRIFAYPDMEKMNMRERMSVYRQMADAPSIEGKTVPERGEQR